MHDRTATTKLTRRQLLRLSAGGAAALALPALVSAPVPAAAHGTLRPVEATGAILAAVERRPLVALCERHMLQEWHDLIQAVVRHPDLSRRLDDIVVEFGNSAYQALCDRFVVDGEAVALADLAQIWRQIGDPTWNAPVYEQLYRSVRAVNATRPAGQRVRILLGQAPVTMSHVATHPHDRARARALAAPMDEQFATVVEREVLARGRRALLIAGKGHLLRNLSTDRNAKTPNAITKIIRTSRAEPYVIDNLLLPPGAPPDHQAARAEHELTRTPAAVVAPLAGTWLGATSTSSGGGWINELADRALTPAANRYDQQADAVLYVGPGDTLTASQPDPAIYHWGSYPKQLREAARLAGAGDQLALALHWATSSPGYFNLFR